MYCKMLRILFSLFTMKISMSSNYYFWAYKSTKTCGLVCCLRHVQPPTSPQQGTRDDWRRTPDRPDTHHTRKQTLLRDAEREEEPLATTTKRTTTGKCTGTDVVQHLHQRPAHTRRHSQLHLRRRLVHRVARKQLQ